MKLKIGDKVKVIAGDLKNETHYVAGFKKNRLKVLLKDIYGLTSKKKVYPRTFDISNLKVIL